MKNNSENPNNNERGDKVSGKSFVKLFDKWGEVTEEEKNWKPGKVSSKDLPNIVSEHKPESSKEFNPFTEEELRSRDITLEDLRKRGYSILNPEHDKAFKIVANNANKKLKEYQKKEEYTNNVELLFTAGGPQKGDILDVNENGKMAKYYILENDGKNITFKINNEGPEQKISPGQAKNFLTTPGITFGFAKEEDKKEKGNTKQENPVEFTKEDQENYDRLIKEIPELEKEIADLEKLYAEKLAQEAKEKESVPEEPEMPTPTPQIEEEQTFVAEQMNPKQLEAIFENIVTTQNFSSAFQKLNLYNPHAKIETYGNKIHVKVEFDRDRKKVSPVYLQFDLVSDQGKINPENSNWNKEKQNWAYKIQKLTELHRKSAEGWAKLIQESFVKEISKDRGEQFEGLNIKNGILQIINKK